MFAFWRNRGSTRQQSNWPDAPKSDRQLSLGLIILRATFLMVCIGLAVSILWQNIVPDVPWMNWAVFLGVLLLAIGVIAIDVAIPRKPLDVISAVYFGLIVGLFLAYVAGLALTPILPPQAERIRSPVQLILAAVLCYTCISLLLQTRHDFRFVIPYVEFSKEVRGRRPYILDTSVVIDGRIADVVDANLFESFRPSPTARTGCGGAGAAAGSIFSTSSATRPTSISRFMIGSCPSSPGSLWT